MQSPRISLDQWRALVAVVEAGGYAQAAELMSKSQSAVTYAVQRLESLLGVEVFSLQGRRAELTPTGRLMYRRARTLLEQAGDMEKTARTLAAGWEAEINLVVEVIFPVWLLLGSLNRFGEEAANTRIEVIESVLGGGGPEALLSGQAQLAILNRVPPGFLAESLLRVRFLPVAHPEHALHRLGRALSVQDLQAHRSLVVRETGQRREAKVRIDASQRWTVGNMSTSIGAVCRGYGFAWFPEDKIRDELRDGSLKVLPLQSGGDSFAELYLVLPDPDAVGPGTQRLAQIIREDVRRHCEGGAKEGEPKLPV